MTRSASPLRPRAALFVLAVALVPVGAAQTGAQSRASASWKVPRTPWGAPDLQGVWTSADLSVPSDDAPRAPAAPPAAPAGAGGLGDVNPPNHWGERIQRVTFNVSPMTPLGQERAATPRLGAGSFMTGNFAGPEELGTWVRCLSRGMPGAMTPTAYNNNYQIVQSQDHVAVIAEMIHDARVIPLRPEPHIASVDSPVAGRFTRAMGGRHTGRRGHEYYGQGEFSGFHGEPSRDGAVHADGPRHAALRGDPRGRSGMERALEILHRLCARPRSGPRVRVRVSRGQLRHAKHPERVTDDGRGSSC